jgi:hypothetical protein
MPSASSNLNGELSMVLDNSGAAESGVATAHPPREVGHRGQYPHGPEPMEQTAYN